MVAKLNLKRRLIKQINTAEWHVTERLKSAVIILDQRAQRESTSAHTVILMLWVNLKAPIGITVFLKTFSAIASAMTHLGLKIEINQKVSV
ncbi:MAG TPA: hypothetical protein DCM33_01500 [Acinetobacter radioresistens]|nr:hypothetical protein [Acinetobacter radioresistens]